APHAPLVQGGLPALLARRAEQVLEGLLAVVVVLALQLQQPIDVLGIRIGPVREQHDVLAIRGVPLPASRLDHYRSVESDLLLEARMTVVPVAAGLIHTEAVNEGLAGRNAREAQPWNAVHVGRDDHSMPVD